MLPKTGQVDHLGHFFDLVLECWIQNPVSAVSKEMLEYGKLVTAFLIAVDHNYGIRIEYDDSLSLDFKTAFRVGSRILHHYGSGCLFFITQTSFNQKN